MSIIIITTSSSDCDSSLAKLVFKTFSLLSRLKNRFTDQLINNSLKRDIRSFYKTWKLKNCNNPVNSLHINGLTNSCDITERFKNKFSKTTVTISATGGDNNNNTN